MAGGKETPRQKMIGMMYLVLTALLALNVSTSVLEKFVLINETFEDTNADVVSDNLRKVDAIRDAVKESGNRTQDLAVLTKAEEVKKKTQEVIADISAYKDMLIDRSGGYDDHKNFKGQKDVDTPSAMFVNEGMGDELKKKLNGYSAFLREVTGNKEIRDIAKDAKDIKVFKEDPNQNRKGFAELNFGHMTPMVGALATLSQLQSDVLAEETKALEELAAAVGAADLKFDKIIPMVKPVSKYVAAGTKYEADLFITAASSSVLPTMKVDGKEIPVEGGFGKVSFMATPGNYDKDGNARKTFIGEITLAQPGKADTTFTDTIEYFVQRPVIQIQSASVQALYLNCGNELNVQVPALGTSYNPSFGVTGGTSVKGSNRGEVTVIPQAAKVTLSVSSNGNLIGTQEFKVKRIPKPNIVVLSGGKEINLKTGVKGAPSSITLKAEADESFAQFLPNDARYRVAQADITLVRSGRAVVPMKANSPNVNLSQISGAARPGDVIVIEVKKVQRKNFQDKLEDVATNNSIIQVRIN